MGRVSGLPRWAQPNQRLYLGFDYIRMVRQKTKEEAMSQRTPVTSRSQKRPKLSSSLILTQCDPGWASDLQKYEIINSCCFTTLAWLQKLPHSTQLLLPEKSRLFLFRRGQCSTYMQRPNLCHLLGKGFLLKRLSCS